MSRRAGGLSPAGPDMAPYTPQTFRYSDGLVVGRRGEEGAMPTVRLRDASEYPEPARRLFDTKIADTLQLESDMGHIAPVDPTPAPGASS